MPRTNIVFVAILAFGSALTLFFWTKWMGKIIMVTAPQEQVEKTVNIQEWVALYILSARPCW